MSQTFDWVAKFRGGNHQKTLLLGGGAIGRAVTIVRSVAAGVAATDSRALAAAGVTEERHLLAPAAAGLQCPVPSSPAFFVGIYIAHLWRF